MDRKLTTLVVIGLLALPVAALAEARSSSSGHDETTALIQRISGPADHLRLAERYRLRAREARNAASRHEHMSHAYEVGSRLEAKRHCQELVESYELQAEKFDALAELHEEEASAASK